MIDLLLSYWLTVHTGDEVVIEHLFADFKKWLQAGGKDAAEVILSIRHYADRMVSIRELPDTDPTSLLLDRMDATQTNTPWPVLLYLHANDGIPTAQRNRAAAAIDSFLMRRGVCRLTAKDYNRLFLQVLEAVKASAPEHAGEAVCDALLGQTADSRRWPTDAEFVASITQPNLFHLLVRARLKAVLVGIENHLRTGKTEPGSLLRSSDQQLSVEHLLPQSWEKNWPVAASPLDESYEGLLRQRREAVHQLGNLTLATSKLNPSLSNKAWKHKKKELQKHSRVRITGESVLTPPSSAKDWDDEMWATDWDEERIALRTSWLSDLALTVWPKSLTQHSPPDSQRSVPVAIDSTAKAATP